MKYMPKANKREQRVIIDENREWIFPAQGSAYGLKKNTKLITKHKEALMNNDTVIKSELLEDLLELPTTQVRIFELVRVFPTQEARILDDERILQKFEFEAPGKFDSIYLDRQYLSIVLGNVPNDVMFLIDPRNKYTRVYVTDRFYETVAVIMPVQTD